MKDKDLFNYTDPDSGEKLKMTKHFTEDMCAHTTDSESQVEEFYDKKLSNDMDAIAAMLARSEQEGLQCEVVYQFAQFVQVTDIPRACYRALEEWIK